MADEIASVTVAILAGGLGTRLRSEVPDRPKALAQIGGRPFLCYPFDQIAAAGFRDVVVCAGYLGEQLEAVFAHAYGPLRLRYAQEPAPLGTAGALRFALPLLSADTVLVMNGDSFCETDLPAFWVWHRQRSAAASILLSEVPDAARYGRVHTDPQGLVSAFEEKSQAGPGWVNAGIYLMARHVLSSLPTGHPVSLEGDVFPRLIGHGLYGYRSQSRFMDIGTPETYRAAQKMFTPTRA
ncbi:MAG: nucleotidyltransferase family protein [Candidatus Omnitrophica bacterium]|nr:nucleotidyltransferase family protein [Candidatus Omnitrophota bacterium]